MSLSGRQLRVHCRSNSVELTPSIEDIATTRRLKEAGDLLGIRVQDQHHVRCQQVNHTLSVCDLVND